MKVLALGSVVLLGEPSIPPSMGEELLSKFVKSSGAVFIFKFK